MTVLLTVLGILFVYMSLAFIMSLITRDNGIADIAYGGGFVLVVWSAYLLGAPGLLSLIACILVSVWALRLSTRIFLRNHGKTEDFRYKKWREEWGSTFVVRSFLQVFMLQGLVIFIVSLPVSLLAIYGTMAGVNSLALAGIAVWLVGFFFEAVGDAQLGAFIKRPENKGKIMNQGLWKYTRHPNYFGESVMWWGLAIVSVSVLGNGLLGLAALAGPVLITFLLLKVSGVPMLEARMAGNPAWEEYAKKTSVFIPLPPKK
ncbi:DUF1295 domain-containing protein [Patescibacteria group bacterium]|nr:DUF1295 domain-containing protein [Patescibacteria group bacterium]MBU1754863.1 DUF1295 domain-containing protein [Patescibacteria group bacterium]